MSDEEVRPCQRESSDERRRREEIERACLCEPVAHDESIGTVFQVHPDCSVHWREP